MGCPSKAGKHIPKGNVRSIDIVSLCNSRGGFRFGWAFEIKLMQKQLQGTEIADCIVKSNIFGVETVSSTLENSGINFLASK
jgi:hypothetical protein